MCLILIKFNVCWLPTWIFWLLDQFKVAAVPSEYRLVLSLAHGWWHDMSCLWNALLLLTLVRFSSILRTEEQYVSIVQPTVRQAYAKFMCCCCS